MDKASIKDRNISFECSDEENVENSKNSDENEDLHFTRKAHAKNAEENMSNKLNEEAESNSKENSDTDCVQPGGSMPSKPLLKVTPKTPTRGIKRSQG